MAEHAAVIRCAGRGCPVSGGAARNCLDAVWADETANSPARTTGRRSRALGDPECPGWPHRVEGRRRPLGVLCKASRRTSSPRRSRRGDRRPTRNLDDTPEHTAAKRLGPQRVSGRLRERLLGARCCSPALAQDARHAWHRNTESFGEFSNAADGSVGNSSGRSGKCRTANERRGVSTVWERSRSGAFSAERRASRRSA